VSFFTFNEKVCTFEYYELKHLSFICRNVEAHAPKA
jgi:hypothetical protein